MDNRTFIVEKNRIWRRIQWYRKWKWNSSIWIWNVWYWTLDNSKFYGRKMVQRRKILKQDHNLIEVKCFRREKKIIKDLVFHKKDDICVKHEDQIVKELPSSEKNGNLYVYPRVFWKTYVYIECLLLKLCSRPSSVNRKTYLTKKV